MITGRYPPARAGRTGATDLRCPDCANRRGSDRFAWWGHGWIIEGRGPNVARAYADATAAGDRWWCVEPDGLGAECGHLVVSPSALDQGLWDEVLTAQGAAGRQRAPG
jgi:hypothetical protein